MTRDDYMQDDTKKKIEDFNKKLEERLDDTSFILDDGEAGTYLDMPDDDEYLDDMNPGVVQDPGLTPTEEEYDDMLIDDRPEADDEEAIDKYLNTELILDVGTNNERRGRVIKRSRGQDGEPIGRAHTNPLFDTREYDIEFTDGSIEKYTANIIAENMYAQVDSEGHQHLLLDEIVNHEADATAIPISEGYYTLPNGNRKAKVSLLQSKRYPPVKGRLINESIRNSVFGHFDRIRFLQVL